MAVRRVRALTYNVRTDVAADAPYDWDGRRDAVASTLRFHRPDVVGLQEPLAHQYDDLRAALPAFEWVGRGRGAPADHDEYCPVGYRRDRFELFQSGTVWLSETPAEPGSVGWDASWPRIVTWVRLRDERTDDSLVFLNTHLDHESERARRRSADLILEKLPDLRGGDPAVLAGDFNCTAGSEPYRILVGETERESPLVDAKSLSPYPPHGPDTTRTDFESLEPDRQIDHVFVAGAEVANYGVAADLFGDGWCPSDHLPVIVDLSL